MSLLVIDNYDSFTYNLIHLVEANSREQVEVWKNDEIRMDEAGSFDRILLSPGPGLPSNAGKMNELIRNFQDRKKILGICLGLQALGEVAGAKLKNLKDVVHGRATPVYLIKEDRLFAGVPSTFNAGRYHSWVIDRDSDLSQLNVTAVDDDGEIMAVSHKKFDSCGVQFHPESILSEFGQQIIRNWLLE